MKFISLASLIALVGYSQAIKTVTQESRGFKLELTKVRKSNKTQSLIQCLDDKCTFPTVDGKSKADQPMINLNDSAYVADIYVGTPPQKIRAMFDTGSSNSWILNKKTKISEQSYDETKSSTYKPAVPAQKASIEFGLGSLSGPFVNDNLTLGQCSTENGNNQIVLKNFKFGSVEKQSNLFKDDTYQAIIGMAYPTLAEKNVLPIFDEMMHQKLLQKNVFAFYLATAKSGQTSDLTFGYWDTTKFTGEISWHKIDFQYMFGVKLSDIKFNGKSSNVCQLMKEGCLLTFDSGSSLMSFPPIAVKALAQVGVPFYDHVQKCNKATDFGNMEFVIDGKNYSLDNKEWMNEEVNIPKSSLVQGGTKEIMFKSHEEILGPQMMAQVDLGKLNAQHMHAGNKFDFDSTTALYQEKKDSINTCFSQILDLGIERDMFLVGDVFMRKYYTIFDRDNNKVGLAKAKGYVAPV